MVTIGTIERAEKVWRIRGGNLVLDIDRRTGCPVRMTVSGGRTHVWLEEPADVQIRDDRLHKTSTGATWSPFEPHSGAAS